MHSHKSLLHEFIAAAMMFFCGSAASHALTISGSILETDTRVPLGGVIVKGKLGTKIVRHTISKKDGTFKIEIPDSVVAETVLDLTAHGYEQKSIPARQISAGAEILMTPQADELAEVVVRPLAVVAKGDTLTYNVDAVRNIADRTIEDVISHLPGVEVSNGQIRYNGEPINRFYVEGLDALGGRYATATQNIRAEDVANINIYENHEPKQVMRDQSLSKQAALNIKLKKRSLLRPSGHISAGIGKAGEGVAWLGKAFGMLISPKLQVYLTGEGNNFGITPDNGGTFSSGPALPTQSLLLLSSVGGVNIPSQLFLSTRRANALANVAMKTGKYATLRLSAGYGFLRSSQNGETLTVYPLSDGTGSQTITQKGASVKRTQSISLDAIYEHNAPAFYLNNSLRSGVRFSRGLASISANPGGDVTQKLNSTDFAILDNLNVISKSDERIWEGNLDLNFHNLPLNTLLATDDTADEVIVDQSARSLAFSANAYTNFGWVVRNASTLGVSLRLRDTYSRINTVGWQDDYSALIGINTPRGNEAVVAIGPTYKFSTRNFNLETGIPVEIVAQRFSQLADRDIYKKTSVHLAPYADFNLWISENSKGNLGVNFSRSTSGIENFITRPIATSFRTITTPGTGTPSLTSLVKVTAGWSWRKVTAGFFSSVSAGYLSMKNDRMLSMDITGTDAASGYVDIKNTMRRWHAMLSMSKLVLGQKGTLKLDISYSLMKSNTMRNGNLLGVTSSNVSSALSFVAPLVNNHIVIKPTVVADRSAQSSGDSFSTALFTWQAMLPATFLPFKNFDLTVTPDFRSNPLTDAGRMNVFMLNAKARYVARRWEFELQMNNLTDRRVYAVENYSDLIYTSTRVNLKGLEAIFTLRYNF